MRKVALAALVCSLLLVSCAKREPSSLESSSTSTIHFNDEDVADGVVAKARQGDPQSLMVLGLNRLQNDDAAPEDTRAAITMLEAAAAGGQVEAQATLGLLYLRGREVDMGPAVAVSWLTKAADRQNAAGQYGLGLAYRDGVAVTRDAARAVRLFTDSASQGYAPAQTALGLAYELGDGVTLDPVRAAQWLRKAADRSDADGQYQLGLLYESGQGVEGEDAAAAKKWFTLAADQGHQAAMEKIGGKKAGVSASVIDYTANSASGEGTLWERLFRQ